MSGVIRRIYTVAPGTSREDCSLMCHQSMSLLDPCLFRQPGRQSGPRQHPGPERGERNPRRPSSKVWRATVTRIVEHGQRGASSCCPRECTHPDRRGFFAQYQARTLCEPWSEEKSVYLRSLDAIASGEVSRRICVGVASVKQQGFPPADNSILDCRTNSASVGPVRHPRFSSARGRWPSPSGSYLSDPHASYLPRVRRCQRGRQ